MPQYSILPSATHTSPDPSVERPRCVDPLHGSTASVGYGLAVGGWGGWGMNHATA